MEKDREKKKNHEKEGGVHGKGYKQRENNYKRKGWRGRGEGGGGGGGAPPKETFHRDIILVLRVAYTALECVREGIVL